jgi:hypothetical protein
MDLSQKMASPSICSSGGGGGNRQSQALEIHKLALNDLLATVAAETGE